MYLHKLIWWIVSILAVFLVAAFLVPILIPAAKLAVLLFIVLLLLDLFLLFVPKSAIKARRSIRDRFSNGDDNPVDISVKNEYAFPVNLEVIDEAPIQFQFRNQQEFINLKSGEGKDYQYVLNPTERGVYNFGALNVYASSPLRLLAKRYRFDQEKDVAVFPSYLQMRKYELIAFSNRLKEHGLRKIRRIGQSMEFEQIRNYVVGDDYRLINWKATARKNELHVNQFQDERSQRIYAVIDKGRTMHFPFNGMTLLDYSINASLAICNIAIKKGDKAGLVSFNNKLNSILPASDIGGQMKKIQELLYREETDFMESSFDQLYGLFRTRFSTRSLLLVFTNFTSVSGVHRRLPYLRKLARQHVVVVIFFEDQELKSFLSKRSDDTEKVYSKVIGEQFAYDKRLVAKELERHGIQALLTNPQNLTIDTINKYLEIKSRGIL